MNEKKNISISKEIADSKKTENTKKKITDKKITDKELMDRELTDKELEQVPGGGIFDNVPTVPLNDYDEEVRKRI